MRRRPQGVVATGLVFSGSRVARVETAGDSRVDPGYCVGEGATSKGQSTWSLRPWAGAVLSKKVASSISMELFVTAGFLAADPARA